MMTNPPRVSVIVPCYQNSETIERTVRSIQAQTMTDWELIAIDDGSKDETLAVLFRIAQDEPRMHVLHQENAGVSAARNAGQDAARGTWLCFVDADDHLTAHALEYLLSLTDEETDIVCGAYQMRYLEEGGRSERHACADGNLQTVLESLIRGDSALNSPCARLYRAQMIRSADIRAPLGVKIGEDVLYNLEAFTAARAWRMSQEVVYIYEYGGDSAMMRAKKERYAASIPMLGGVALFLRKNGMQTTLFRAHIDLYVRTLRADHGRVKAALALTRAMVRTITMGVNMTQLPFKQKLYYLALRICPALSLLLP